MLCVLAADETKGCFKKVRPAKMYLILFISEYICQAGKFQRRLVPSTKWKTTQGNLCQQKVLWLGATSVCYVLCRLP